MHTLKINAPLSIVARVRCHQPDQKYSSSENDFLFLFHRSSFYVFSRTGPHRNSLTAPSISINNARFDETEKYRVTASSLDRKKGQRACRASSRLFFSSSSTFFITRAHTSVYRKRRYLLASPPFHYTSPAVDNSNFLARQKTRTRPIVRSIKWIH